uniref:Uncharacterized protein n=1 Tax=Rhizophora mucronata TaxID=61149 RepID=A0A2P2LRP5_RHIMU
MSLNKSLFRIMGIHMQFVLGNTLSLSFCFSLSVFSLFFLVKLFSFVPNSAAKERALVRPGESLSLSLPPLE